MKKLLLNLAVVFSIFAATSCEDDGGGLTINQDIDYGNGGITTPTTSTLSGFVLSGENKVLDPNIVYSLNGPLIVKEGATLTIPAGTKIVAQNGADVYIAVMQGAKIMAQGTASQPILLTAEDKTPGAWGGLILLGKAPINSGLTATSEIGGFNYGGTDPNDNSGVVEYVIVEYSGGAVDAASENNGFSFYGVGNGTIVNHIESYYGSDDGVEFFGGTVNASNIVLIGNEDDSLDWTEGYTGNITDVYIRHEGTKYDKAIEADGYNPDLGINVDPVFYSNPTLTNVTIEGLGSSTDIQNQEGISVGSYEGIRLREATQANFNNIVVRGFGRAFQIKGNGSEDSSLTSGHHVLNGDLTVKGKFEDVTTNVKNDSGVDFDETQFIILDNNANGTNVNAWARSWASGL